MLWYLCFKYKKWNIETLNDRKIQVFFVVELINESWDFVILLFRLAFNVPHMQTTDKLNVLEPAENIGVSLEPWA